MIALPPSTGLPTLTLAMASDLLARTRKELATRSLYEFVKQGWHVVEPETPFVDNWHVEALCNHLQEVSDGTLIRQLLINIPPGTMKSLLTCVFWPCWVWTHKPEKRWFFASYDGELSMRDSVKCRDLINSEWYQKNWGDVMQLAADQNSKTNYKNTRGGWRMSSSVGGKATGHHPDFIVVDDPHNAKGAESDADRKGVITWWDGTMTTRGKSRGVKRVIVMQRLHTKDLSQHLLDKGGWTHICLPMQYEAPTTLTLPDGTTKTTPRMPMTPLGWSDPRKTDGELLWPSLFTLGMVGELAVELGIYHAAGQLQQRPAPREGGMFKRVWFNKIISALPNNISKFVRYWDKAGTEGGDGARTAGALLAVTRTGSIIICDVKADRLGAVEREKLIHQTAVLDKKQYGHVEIWTEQEPGSGGKESAESTVRNLVGFVCKLDRVTGSKEIRAEPLASQASVGNVWLLDGAWIPEFIDEAEVFPAGKCKDKIDAAGGAFNKLYVSKVKAIDPNRLPGQPKPEVVEPGVGTVKTTDKFASLDNPPKLGESDF